MTRPCQHKPWEAVGCDFGRSTKFVGVNACDSTYGKHHLSFNPLSKATTHGCETKKIGVESHKRADESAKQSTRGGKLRSAKRGSSFSMSPRLKVKVVPSPCKVRLSDWRYFGRFAREVQFHEVISVVLWATKRQRPCLHFVCVAETPPSFGDMPRRILFCLT